MINIDWFQPYKHVQYSVGAIYLIVLNLSCNLRYRKENMILVGIKDIVLLNHIILVKSLTIVDLILHLSHVELLMNIVYKEWPGSMLIP